MRRRVVDTATAAAASWRVERLEADLARGHARRLGRLSSRARRVEHVLGVVEAVEVATDTAGTRRIVVGCRIMRVFVCLVAGGVVRRCGGGLARR